MSERLMMRTPAVDRGCALYHDDDATMVLRIWDAFLAACGVQPDARREALHQLARWWCPGLRIEGSDS